MKKFLHFILITAFCNFAFGQEREAKLLFKDGSNVAGFGEIKKNKIYFRLTKDENPEEWTEDDAKGLEFTGYRQTEKYIFIVHGKKNEIHLMEAIQEGNVALYKDTYFTTQYTPINTQSTRVKEIKNIDYYIKKPTDEKGIKVDMDFKKIGQAFFSDCEDLMANINEEAFSEEEEIIDLVKFYNRNCSK
ncbi:hypothetical protein [Flavobacterium wongokense]|uniref:hypothetical protein n=1 Tax=Flavobacterium wongokense TaxID=2910674 RepID=UPI001F4401C6|nr:hypothetical protein [Flavobacterium sp. WG47]MCF6130759.1 hypothetical protein [Flavobacterium sp. WG47]